MKKQKCNRTACNTPVCTHYHIDTGELYCVKCARKINEYNPERQLMYLIGTQPKMSEEEIQLTQEGYDKLAGGWI